MAIQSASTVSYRSVPEVTRNVTPASPTMGELRFSGPNTSLTKRTLELEEVRSSRQEADIRHGFNEVVGSPTFNLSRVDFDSVLQVGMQAALFTVGLQQTAAGSPLDFVFSDVDNSIATSTDRWKDNLFQPGMKIVVAGTASNNGTFHVYKVDATKLYVVEALTNETIAATATVVGEGRQLRVGTTLSTFTVERAFLDISVFEVFRGVGINDFELNLTPEQPIGGSLTLLGMSAAAPAASTIASVVNPASTNKAFTSFVGAMWENGAPIGIVTDMTVRLSNRMTNQPVLFSRFTPDLFPGTTQIGGTLTVLFQDKTMYEKFYNETESSVMVRMDDPNGTDYHMFSVPRLAYLSGAPDDIGQDGPVSLTMEYRGLEDPVIGTSFAYSVSNV